MINVISYPRSGLTWLRWMVRRYVELGRDDLTCSRSRNPIFRFTHDDMGLTRTNRRVVAANLRRRSSPMAKKHVVFLMRDPRDCIASNWNLLQSIPFDEFLRDEALGIYPMVNWLKWWDSMAPHSASFETLRYEDMRSDTESEIAWFLKHSGHPVSDDLVKRIVQDCSIEKMRRYEDRHKRLIGDVRGVRGRAVRSGKICQWNHWDDSDIEFAAEAMRGLRGTFAECYA